MDQNALFAAALGLTPPWQVRSVSFDLAQKRLDITIGFPPGSEFVCPSCGSPHAKAYDTDAKEWRHLNFFQHEAWLRAQVPRVQCDRGCGVKRIDVPWARPGSGFTLLFEALVMTLAREMPVAAIAKLLSIQDTRIWRMLHHHVDDARGRVDMSDVQRVGLDETASRRGHNYISVFFDMDQGQLLFATSGKDKQTVSSFAKDLQAHKGKPKSILQVCSDMSAAFIAGVGEEFPQAEITFDRFHIMKIIGEAVDQVRREEAKSQPLLTNTRYIWLKNRDNLTAKQTETLASLQKHHLKTARAYQIRLSFQDFFQQPNRQQAEAFLNKWYFWATHSRLQPIIDAARTIKRHWQGVLNWQDSHLTTGLVEGFNSLLQAAKARAKGYRSDRNFITMAYLLGGQLQFALPT